MLTLEASDSWLSKNRAAQLCRTRVKLSIEHFHVKRVIFEIILVPYEKYRIYFVIFFMYTSRRDAKKHRLVVLPLEVTSQSTLGILQQCATACRDAM